MGRSSFLAFILLFSVFSSFGQTRFKAMLFLNSKSPNTYSISQPNQFLTLRSIARRERYGIPLTEKDLPVSNSLLQSLRGEGANILYVSRWLNAVLVDTDSLQWIRLQNLPMVSGSQKLSLNSESALNAGGKTKLAGKKTDFGSWQRMFNQIGIQDLDALARPVNDTCIIAVFDAGFLNFNTHSFTRHIVDERRLVDQYDFVDRSRQGIGDDSHGTEVLSCIASRSPGNMVTAGNAAKFILYRTENAATEYPVEMFYWLAAAERADSLGADIINSSLGYNYFDNSRYDINYSTMDGNSVLITKAADLAASVGIIVVNSAGNEGNNGLWRGKITAPCDADSILCVGSIDVLGQTASSSGRGPTSDSRIKPDVVCFGSSVTVANPYDVSGSTTASGTSFASPFIAGLMKLCWDYNLTHGNIHPYQLIQVFKESCTMDTNNPAIPTPTNTNGFGLFRWSRFISRYQTVNTNYKARKTGFSIVPNPSSTESVFVKVPDLSKIISLALFNSAGQKVGASFTKNPSAAGFDVLIPTKLTAGVYSLVISLEGNQLALPIIRR